MLDTPERTVQSPRASRTVSSEPVQAPDPSPPGGQRAGVWLVWAFAVRSGNDAAGPDELPPDGDELTANERLAQRARAPRSALTRRVIAKLMAKA